MEIKKISIVMGIILGLCSFVGIVLTVNGHFAKTEEVEKTKTQLEEKHVELERTDALIAERIDIGITDDRIYQQQQQKRRLEDMIVIQRVPREPTDAEKEAIREKEEEIKRLQKERDEKRKFYQEMRKSK